MRILRPCDVENECRLALSGLFNVHCPPLPANYATPCLLIRATGGSSTNTVDTFTVVIDSRGTENDAALEYLRNALGALEAQAQAQVGALRNVALNSLYSWGTDPVRPDLKLCSATVLVTCHREAHEIESN